LAEWGDKAKELQRNATLKKTLDILFAKYEQEVMNLGPEQTDLFKAVAYKRLALYEFVNLIKHSVDAGKVARDELSSDFQPPPPHMV